MPCSSHVPAMFQPCSSGTCGTCRNTLFLHVPHVPLEHGWNMACSRTVPESFGTAPGIFGRLPKIFRTSTFVFGRCLRFSRTRGIKRRSRTCRVPFPEHGGTGRVPEVRKDLITLRCTNHHAAQSALLPPPRLLYGFKIRSTLSTGKWG